MKSTLISLGAVAAIFGLFMLDPLARARVFTGIFMGGGFALIVLFIGIAILIFGICVEKVSGIVIGSLALLASIPIAFGATWHAYVELRDTVEVVSAEQELLPETGLRAPYQIAERQASSNSSGTVGDLQGTTYLPGSDKYSTLVHRRGLLGPGYETLIVQKLALTGQAKGERCDFSTAADKRIDGIFGHSLTRAIAKIDHGLIAKKDDTWGYCNDGTPMVVVPVTKLKNWFAPVDVPAGVVIYNGTTGQIEHKPVVAAGELPGPAISISQSRRVNAALKTLNGSWWSTNILRSTGITDEVKDEDDTNIGSHSNFSLAYGRNQFGFFSPFTSRASSRTIDDVAVLDSSNVVAGTHAAVKLHHLKTPRQSNAATADRIKADYSNLNDWATGMAVMEIVPGGEGIWHASVGQKQNVNYRLQLNADGSSCLLSAQGEKLRCSDEDLIESPDGKPAAGSDLIDPKGLNDEQLKQLHEAILDEVHSRIANK